MIAVTGWLAHLDVPTVDARVLVTPPALTQGRWPHHEPVVVLAGAPRAGVGVLDWLYVADGWLRGTGLLNLGALPVGYRHQRVFGAEIDVDVDQAERTDSQLLITSWRLRAVVIGDGPVWPEARLEVVG